MTRTIALIFTKKTSIYSEPLAESNKNIKFILGVWSLKTSFEKIVPKTLSKPENHKFRTLALIFTEILSRIIN